MVYASDPDGDGTGGNASEAYTYHAELRDETSHSKANEAANTVGAVWTPSDDDDVLTGQELEQFNQKLEGTAGSGEHSLLDTGVLQATPEQRDQWANIMGGELYQTYKVKEGDLDGDGTDNAQEVSDTVTGGSSSGGGDGGTDGGSGGLLSDVPIPEIAPSIGPFSSKMTTLLVLVLALAVISTATGG